MSALASSIRRDSWDACESRVVANTQRLLAIFEQSGVKGTFFVLGWVAERYPRLIRDIAASGHEIACHGLRWISYQNMDEATERAHMREAVQIIRELTGSAPQGWYSTSRW